MSASIFAGCRVGSLVVGLWMLAAQTTAFSSNAQNPVLHQVGVQIVDAHGNPVELRGVNLGGWLLWEGWIFGEPGLSVTSATETKISNHLTKLAGADATQVFRRKIYDGFITKEDIAQISKAGFNSVRVPLNHRLFARGELGWQKLRQLLGWCKEYGIYAVLDLHSAPGGQSTCWWADPEGIDASLPAAPGLLWSSRKYQDETVALWREIARRFKDDKSVGGYDLLNEPVSPNGPALLGLYQRLIQAIREVDPNHLIILEGGDSSGDFSMFKQAPCENMAYSFHIYWFAGDGAARLNGYQSIGERQNRPFWAGEFGEPLTYSWIDQKVRQFRQRKAICGWAFWTWKKTRGGAPGLVTVKTPTHWLSIMRRLRNPIFPPLPGTVVAAGMKEFPAAMKSAHQPDAEMLKALHLH